MGWLANAYLFLQKAHHFPANSLSSTSATHEDLPEVNRITMIGMIGIQGISHDFSLEFKQHGCVSFCEKTAHPFLKPDIRLESVAMLFIFDKLSVHSGQDRNIITCGKTIFHLCPLTPVPYQTQSEALCFTNIVGALTAELSRLAAAAVSPNVN